MNIFKVRLPMPPSLNAMYLEHSWVDKKSNKMKRAKFDSSKTVAWKKAAKKIIEEAMFQSDMVFPMKGPLTVSYQQYFVTAHKRDYDNYIKAIQDMFCPQKGKQLGTGVIEDDSQFVEAHIYKNKTPDNEAYVDVLIYPHQLLDLLDSV